MADDPQATRRIDVTIELGSEPIAGTTRLPDGSGRRFEGYLELVAQLERVRATGDAAPDAGAERGPPGDSPAPVER